MTIEPAQAGDHVIVCGSNSLASRIAEELTARYGLAVTAIVPPEARGHAARLQATPGVQVLQRAELDGEAFAAAGLATARAVAIVLEDDLANVHAALRVQELRPRVRLVIATFSIALGEPIARLFTDCEVLSQADTAAPSLVASALGELAPDEVPMEDGQVLYVAQRDRVGAGQIVLGLAADIDSDAPSLLPPGDEAAGVVLAAGDRTPRNPLSRRRQRRLTAPLRIARRVFGTQTGLLFAGLLAVVAAGFGLLAAGPGTSPANALYLALTDASGAAATEATLPWTTKLAQILLTLVSLAFVPVVTAAVVGSRIADAAGRDHLQPLDHVIVAGLGRVGTRVVGLLHELGIEVVAVDSNPNATGVLLARQLGARVVTGDPHREETLIAAGITTCQALVSVTSSDIVNLQAALTARKLTERPRIVMRLYDDDLAVRVQPHIPGCVSRSTSYLAAPAFAAAVLRHQILRSIAVGRHVLLLAKVIPGPPGGQVSGRTVSSLNRPGELRVIGIRSSRSKIGWSPEPGYVVQPPDHVFVLATRAGLSGLLAPEAGPPPAPAGAAPADAVPLPRPGDA